jgi:hypothetical protein
VFRKAALLLLSLPGGLSLTGCCNTGRTTLVSARHLDPIDTCKGGCSTCCSKDNKWSNTPPPPRLPAITSNAFPASKTEDPYIAPTPDEEVAIETSAPPMMTEITGTPAPVAGPMPGRWEFKPNMTSSMAPPRAAASGELPSGIQQVGYNTTRSASSIPPYSQLDQQGQKLAVGSIIISGPVAQPGETVVAVEPGEIQDGSGRVTLVGQVESWRKTWCLRYAPVDSDDSQGGSVILVGENELTNLRHGQRVRVQGVMLAAPDRTSPRRFLVQSVQAE